jgi:hypothetical protein
MEDSQSFLGRLFGAGNRRYDYLYYPGGHFLGLSCTNSETNIKSCVNLKRICEVGATMSQRREEVRGYTQEGDVKYRYYVPTGLISNVDIDGASFRAMFATLNHHPLNATERNETTGYKKYNFRFLRPDGFEGSLGSIVHLPNSPYNKKVNDDETKRYITDETTFFERMFMGAWQRPDDYDPKEIEYTERRTVEDQIDDYFMFRFGLDGFSNKEQRKHFLAKKGRGYIFPQYENSFYFYFGLKDGSTALDEFKKQFFSECESNNVMKEPLISIKETIDEDLNGRAMLTIDNMIPPYTITVTDNTLGEKFGPNTFEIDSMQLDRIVETGLSIGHEYTITVEDSLDNTLTKTFVFGADSVKIDAQTVNFRVEATGATVSAKKGGYIKINDKLTILKKEYTVGDGVSFKFRKIDNGTAGPYESYPETVYTDMAGEQWHLYYVPSVGTFEVLVYYHNNYVSVYTTKIEDNRAVNLFVSCDYLSYKPEYKGGTEYAPAINGGLKNFLNAEWYNGAPFHGASWQNWLMRHTYYRQTENDAWSYDNYIYTKGKNEVAIFGQPEKGNNVKNAELMGIGIDTPQGVTPNSSSMDYDDFVGYVVDDTYTYIPTMFFNPTNKEEESSIYRNAFDAMSYSEDGRAAADALEATITSYNFDDGTVTLGFSGGEGKLTNGHGCIVVFEDGTIMFPVVSGANLIAKYSTDIYPTGATPQILSMTTVYPTLRVPSMYKPFYGEISAATWSLVALTVSFNSNNETIAKRNELPSSYKVEGNIFNGLTWENHFYSGDTAEEYDTYFMYRTDSQFYEALTADTAFDYQCKRKITPNGKFGQGTWIPSGFSYGREISGFTDGFTDIHQISYAVREGIPPEEPIRDLYPNVFTERYEGGFDHTLLKDSCAFELAFYNELSVRLLDEDKERDGRWIIYSDEGNLDPSTKYYISTAEVFNKSRDPMFVDERYDEDENNREKYCHGYYNINAKNDRKGEIVSVMRKKALLFGGTKYHYYITKDDGTRKKVKADDEADLYAGGVSLLHEFTIKPEYARTLDSIANVISNGTQFRVSTKGKIQPPFTGEAYKTIVAVYQKPADDTRNKMTVYRLYPIEMLPVMYADGTGGATAYIGAPESESYSKDQQTVTIPVSANVSFMVSSQNSWITFSTTEYDSSATSITATLAANDTGANRQGAIKLTCTESGADVNDVTIVINQSKD